jgi:hypothetical protein
MSATTGTANTRMEARLRVVADGRCFYTLPVREGGEDYAAARAQAIADRISKDRGVTATVEPYVAPVSK